MILTINDLYRVREVLNLSRLGAIAFGEDDNRANNLRNKVNKRRKLNDEEVKDLVVALQRLGIIIEHREPEPDKE